jgi:hypothetical protein
MEAIYSSETLGSENLKSNVLLFILLFMQFLKCTLLVQSLVFYFVADFLPTFGPSYINLYESADSSTLCAALSQKSREYGEAYRGRLLLAVETDILGSCATSSQIHPAVRRVTHQVATPLKEVSKRFINGVWYFIA